MLEMAPYLGAIDLVVCHIYLGAQLKENYQRVGVGVYSLDIKGDYSFWKAYQKLKSIILKEQPDLIHASLLRSSLVSRFLAHRLRIPMVCSLVADSYSKDRYQRLSNLRQFKLVIFQWLDRLTVLWCDAFVSISQSIADSNALSLKIPKDKITIIYRGRDARKFNGKFSSLAKEKPFKFISVGRLIQSKGHEVLIHAFAHEVLRGIEVELTLVGDGPERARLQELVRKYDLEMKIRLLGEQENIPELLSHSNGFLFPSYHEGLGGSLIEAMMMGLPIICSDIAVFQELIQHNESGLKAKVGDAEDWARKIALLVTDNPLAIRLGVNAKHTATDRFDIRIIAAAYMNFYHKVHEDYSTRYKKAV